MEKVENRNNVRLNNQISVINALRKEKKTITDLAEYLEVSFSAARHIIDELVEGGICKYSSKQAVNPRGRTPVFVELNTKAGVVCGIDFSSKDLKIVLASLDGKPIVNDVIENVGFISKEHFQKTEELIRQLLERPEVKGRPLLSICIASPGVIDSKTFEYVNAYRVKDSNKISPVSYFSNAFNVDVEMYNDVRIGSLGELKLGAIPRNVSGCLYIHIGSAGGYSLIFDGKIYKGTHGFAGEPPAYNVDDPVANRLEMSHRIYAIWEIANDIRVKKGEKPLDPGDVVDIDKILKYFNNGDQETIEAVEKCFKYNAINIVGLSSILDLDYVVIEGPIQRFGESAVKRISHYVSEFSLHGIRTRIVPSVLGSDGSLIGACYQAQTIYFFKKLEEINKKRLNMHDFFINPVFKEM